MATEIKLHVKCPQCDSIRLQTLSEIKAQTHYSCACGYETELHKKAHNPFNHGTKAAVVREEEALEMA